MRCILTTTAVAAALAALVALAVVEGLPKSASGDLPAKPNRAATPASAPGPAHPQATDTLTVTGAKTVTGTTIAYTGTATVDEKAILLVAEAFAKAYNAGDAKAIASLFLTDGEIVSEEGQSTRGREGIEQAFAGIFKEHPKTHMDLATGSIRFIGPSMAVEDGVATVAHEPGEPAQRSPYTVVYAKQGGRWLTASAKDLLDEPPTPEEQLKQLEWMIGEWVDESPDALVFTSYRWTDNQCYILGEFKVQIGGRPLMTGTHRIGWDPVAKTIRSWAFDSEGGFSEGIWTRDGNRWIVKMTGVRRDGQTASATNITTRVSKHRMTWQSRDRIVGGEKTPDIEEIPITRKPPVPQ